jgi:hypothetical protein
MTIQITQQELDNLESSIISSLQENLSEGFQSVLTEKGKDTLFEIIQVLVSRSFIKFQISNIKTNTHYESFTEITSAVQQGVSAY